ncbi:hypothetical protein L3Q82_007167 [Scortum barcoo]|uniref:Uncharacterized protein n=1 Tax=Scortum barcoo TaxID=214431 RepID=A0ACB8WSN4_9TELE|nr:hypothetical protein L3Q82_007167 [Scortum barcoo]
MAAELGSYKQAHTSSPPLTLGNSRVVEGPAPLKELGSRAQAMRGGIGSSRPPPRLLPTIPHCTGPSWTFLRVVSLLEGGPTSPFFGLSPAWSRGQRPGHQALSLLLGLFWCFECVTNQVHFEVFESFTIYKAWSFQMELWKMTLVPTVISAKQYYISIYKENRSTEDAVSIALHTALTHLQLPNTYVRMLFVDFQFSLQHSDPGQADTEAPQPGTALIAVPLDQGLPHQQASGGDCSAIHSTNTIVKFADDTTIVGLISDNDETHYREEIQHLTQWCSNNNLVLNTSKTKEVIVDYRRSRRTEHAPLQEAVELVYNIKFLGIHITSDLTWSMNTAHLCVCLLLTTPAAHQIITTPSLLTCLSSAHPPAGQTREHRNTGTRQERSNTGSTGKHK